MLQNMKMRTGIIIILVLSFFFQIISSSMSIYFIDKGQKNTVLINGTTKELKALNRAREAILDERSNFENARNLLLNNLTDVSKFIETEKLDIINVESAFQEFMLTPGLISVNPELSNTIKQAFRAQIAALKQNLNSLESAASTGVFISNTIHFYFCIVYLMFFVLRPKIHHPAT